MSDIAMRLGGFMVMSDASLAKLDLGLLWDSETPDLVFLGLKSPNQEQFGVVWRISRDVLASAAFNNERASDDPDFVIEPIEQALEGIPNGIPWSLKGTMFCHMTGLDWLDEESHEHIILSGAALREFLGDTDKVTPLQVVAYDKAVDAFLADVFK